MLSRIKQEKEGGKGGSSSPRTCAALPTLEGEREGGRGMGGGGGRVWCAILNCLADYKGERGKEGGGKCKNRKNPNMSHFKIEPKR